MNRLINFTGLGFENGQRKKGLAASPRGARSFFHILENAEDGIEIKDCGDLSDIQRDSSPEITSETDLSKINLSVYEAAFEKSVALLEQQHPLIFWGGDHSVSISSVAAFIKKYQDGFVVWIDARADLNLPRKSITGNFHGMPLAVLLNLDGIASRHFSWISQFLDPMKLIYVVFVTLINSSKKQFLISE